MISEPLVKVLRLVDGERPTMGNLFEAMGRGRKAIQSYYSGKGSLRYENYMIIWYLIGDRWNGMLHHPIHANNACSQP
jgi:hypothetical protein